jgi:translocation and assembly module TamB
MRRLLRILIVLAIIGIGLFLAARWYLTSPGVARKAADQLTRLCGGPVRVEHANIGLKSSTLSGVHFHEEGTAGQTWLSVGTVQADVSLWELASGEARPRRLDLKGARLTLRFDQNGRLLTRFPSTRPSQGEIGPLPTVDLEESEVRFRKEGGGEIVLGHVKGTLRSEGSQLVLKGEGSNPRWGKLLFSGRIDPRTGAAALDVKSPGLVHVTQQMLSELPFVPPTIWQEVQAEGDTPVHVKLTYDRSAGTVHYRAELEPKSTRVNVPAAALQGTDASGKLVIDNGLVQLRGVKGRAHEGTLQTDADLDFRGPATHLNFRKLEAHNLDIRLLPKSWGLPEELEGRLDASGSVLVTIENGKVSTSGNAKGEIRNARLAGQPVEGPIELTLAPEGPPLQVETPSGPGGEQVQEPKAAPPPGKRGPTYLTIKLNLKDADIAELVEKLRLKLKVRVAGRLNFHGTVGIPMGAVKEARDYRFTGRATLTNARLGDIRLETVEAEARYDNGVLRLDKLYGVAPGASAPQGDKTSPGTFQGKLVAQLAPAGDLTADLTMDHLPLGEAAKELGVEGAAGSEITGSASVKVSLAKLEKDREWDGSGKIVVRTARAFGWTLEDGGADVKLAGKTLTLANVRGTLEGTPITGSGTVTLEGEHPFTVKLSVKDADLSAVQRLSPDMRPPVTVAGRASVTAKLSGTLEPFHLQASGTAVLAGLKVDRLKFEEIRLRWETDLERLKVTDLKSRLYGGEVTGKAVVPLSEQAAGSVDLTLKDIDVGQLLKEADIALPIEGKAAGAVKGTFAVAAEGKPRAVDLKLDLAAPRLHVQGLEAEGLTGKVRYQGDDIVYDFEARALGGTVQVEGKVPRKGAEEGKEAGEGKLEVRGLRLDRLGPLFGAKRGRFPLSGTVNAELDYRFAGPSRTPEGSGRVVVTDLAWDDIEWLGRVQARLQLSDGRLLLADASATLGEGTVRGRLSWSWKHRQQNWYQVTLERVQAATLLAPWPAVKGQIQGPVSGSVRGKFERDLTGHGTVVLGRGKVAGVPVSELRLPFTAVYAPKRRWGRVQVTGGSGTVALGRVTGDATYLAGAEKKLQGKLKFSNVDLRNLLREAAESAYLGGGKVTGSVDFSAPGLVGLDQLSASLDARLTQTQALQAPGLRQLSPVLGISSNSSFQHGRLRARLANGVFRVERLSLQGGPGNIYATGTVTTRGRLDLDVHASARWAGLSSNNFRVLGPRVSAVTTMPAKMLGNLTNRLAPYLIHARVTGTLRAATVQVMPVRTLGEEVVRFFVGGRA